MDKRPSYGFIVGRFQVHALHDGHLELINLVRSFHKRVVIFLGVAPFKFTQSNPLDFITRKRMIEGKFPDVTCLPLYDMGTDEAWSEQLDQQISLVSNGSDVTLYGGRDSFLPHYFGKYKPVELKVHDSISGTDVRASINSEALDSREFRQGVIYAVHNRYPIVIPTVDIAVFDGDNIILISKTGEKGFRLPGGIVEHRDYSLEARARAEVYEEIGVEIGPVQWLATRQIGDWRLSGEQDKILTTLFTAKYLHGAVRAGDDASAVMRWPFKQLKEKDFVKEHVVLFEILKDRGFPK